MLGKNIRKWDILRFLCLIDGKRKEKRTKEGGIKLAEKYKNFAQKSIVLVSLDKKNIANPKDQKAKLKTNKLNTLITDLLRALTNIKKPKNRKIKAQQNSSDGLMSID